MHIVNIHCINHLKKITTLHSGYHRCMMCGRIKRYHEWQQDRREAEALIVGLLLFTILALVLSFA